MPAYIIVEIAIKDAARYERYKHLAPPSIAKYGGTYLSRGGATTALEGAWAPPRFVILEFPDADTARIAGHLIEFFQHEVSRGRLPRTLPPLRPRHALLGSQQKRRQWLLRQLRRLSPRRWRSPPHQRLQRVAGL